MGDTAIFFCLSISNVHLTYAPVGTGEIYLAFAWLNFLVSLPTFLEAVFLWIVPLEAACIRRFSARASFSFAVSRSDAAIAASKLLMIAFRCDLILLFRAVFLLMTRILFFADFIFAIILHPTFSKFSQLRVYMNKKEIAREKLKKNQL